MTNYRVQKRWKFSRLISALGITLGSLFLIVGMAKGVGADTLILPDNAAGASGGTAQVFLSVANGTGFFSADLDIQFNSAVITATAVVKGALATANGCEPAVNLATPGLARVGLFCTSPVVGNGQLLRLDFNVVGATSATSPLTIATCLLNEGAPACVADNGLFTVVTPLNIAGKIIYYNGLAARPPLAEERPVSAGNVRLLGDVTREGASDATGAYGFPNIVALNPNLTVRPKNIGAFNNAITSFDAALVAQHVVGNIVLNARQKLAADVTANGSLSSLDAARIAMFRVGLIDQFRMGDDCGTDWVFVPDPAPVANQTTQLPSTLVVTDPPPTVCVFGEIGYNPLASDAANQDFIAILTGDVSGNWIPPAELGMVAPQASGPGMERSLRRHAARLRVGERAGRTGDLVTVPVTLHGAHGLLGMDLALSYAADVLSPVGVEGNNLAQGRTLVANTSEPGVIRLGLFGTDDLDREGRLFEITFQVIGEAGEESLLHIIEASINEGAIPVASRPGRVRVR